MSEIHHTTTVKLNTIYFDEVLNDARGKIAPIDVIDLTKSIEANGSVEPVVIAELFENEQKEFEKRYRLISGYRRYTAHRILEWEEIDVVIRKSVSELDARILNLIENTDRQNLNILQEAKAILMLMRLGLTEITIADKINQSRGWVQIRTMLMKLPKDIQLEAAAGIITQTHVRELYTIYIRDGKDKVYEAVRQIKDAASRGKKISVNPSFKKHRQIAVRKQKEIFFMMSIVRENGIGNCIITRTLAWCAGEISSNEFLYALQAYASEQNKIFVVPSEDELNAGSQNDI